MQMRQSSYSEKFPLALAFVLGFVAAVTALFAGQEFQKDLNFLQGESRHCALSVDTVFSPASQNEFVGIIGSAKETLDIMLYQFSNPAMMQALANAVSRGVRVRIILEPRVDANYPTAEFLSQKGIQVRFASKEYTNTHAKTAIIDGKKVLVGSTNWSRQAMRSNRESSVVIQSEALAQEFERVFEEDWAKAKDFVPPEQS